MGHFFVISSGGRPVTTNRRFSPGEILIGRYRILGFHAEGGMQEVYLCHDASLDRFAVLKTPKHGVRDRRFRRGAEMSARVNHPNVAATFDYFQDNEDLTFLVEEFVPGKDLGERLRGEFTYLDPFLTAHVVHHIARALREAHRVGICHRDLKPSNVMTSSDFGLAVVKLTDFGIAKLAESEIEAEMEDFHNDESTLTSSNTLLGAVPYMAPECWDDWRGAGQPMDIWALGCVAYHLLTGAPPFGNGRVAIRNVALYQQNQVPPAPPGWFGQHKSTRNIEESLWEIILMCLRVDPTSRPTAEVVLGLCERLCYATGGRESGVVTVFPHLYENGGRANAGWIQNEADRLFFHGSEFFGAPRPVVGQRVSYAIYPGYPFPRISPVLCLR